MTNASSGSEPVVVGRAGEATMAFGAAVASNDGSGHIGVPLVVRAKDLVTEATLDLERAAIPSSRRIYGRLPPPM